MAVRSRTDTFVLLVDPIQCDGYGHCAELAPELVHLDEWGYPILATTPTPLAARAVRESARLAVRDCPRRALRVERHPGAPVSSRSGRRSE